MIGQNIIWETVWRILINGYVWNTILVNIKIYALLCSKLNLKIRICLIIVDVVRTCTAACHSLLIIRLSFLIMWIQKCQRKRIIRGSLFVADMVFGDKSSLYILKEAVVFCFIIQCTYYSNVATSPSFSIFISCNMCVVWFLNNGKPATIWRLYLEIPATYYVNNYMFKTGK